MPPQRPTEKERGVVEDVEIPRLPSACDVMALFHCMVRHGTVRYGSLLGGFPLGTVPGT